MTLVVYNTFSFAGRSAVSPAVKTARPKVFIPVFPGTNCEMDSKRAFERAGGEVEMQILANLTPEVLDESIHQMAKKIRQSQIIMIPGGFSGGDEPDGSAKFRMLTFLPLEEIEEMDKWEGAQLNKAKEILAYELTALVHGKEEAEKAQTAAKEIFVSGGTT